MLSCTFSNMTCMVPAFGGSFSGCNCVWPDGSSVLGATGLVARLPIRHMRRAGRMNSVIALVSLIIVVADAQAGESGTPGRTPNQAASATEEIPTPSGTPQPQAAPDLLPGSDQLPASPPILGPLQPPAPSSVNSNASLQPIKQLSPEEQARNKVRLAELRPVAMRNARAVVLLKEADGALTDEAKREFMRAYYHTLCNCMRDLDPGLSQTIAEFEHSEIRKLALGPSHLPVIADFAPQKTHLRRQRRSE
jgi:hypothetical protein